MRPAGPVFHVGRRARAGMQVTARAGARGGGRSRRRGPGGSAGQDLAPRSGLRPAPTAAAGPAVFRTLTPWRPTRSLSSGCPRGGGRRRRGPGRVAADSGRHPPRPRRWRRPGPLRRGGGGLHDAADQVRPRRGTRRPCRTPPAGGCAASRGPGPAAAPAGPGALTGPGPARTAGPAGAEAGRGGGGERGDVRRGWLDTGHPRADHRVSHLAAAHRPPRPRPAALTGRPGPCLGPVRAASLWTGRAPSGCTVSRVPCQREIRPGTLSRVPGRR